MGYLRCWQKTKNLGYLIFFVQKAYLHSLNRCGDYSTRKLESYFYAEEAGGGGDSRKGTEILESVTLRESSNGALVSTFFLVRGHFPRPLENGLLRS